MKPISGGHRCVPAYQAELTRFTDQLAELLALAETAVGRATTALLEADLALANEVVIETPEIQERHHRLDAEALSLLARQQPVATDLRTLVAGLRMSEDLERMGVIARHVAEIVRQRHPHHVVPACLNGTVGAMGAVAKRFAAEAHAVLETKDAEKALELESEDDEMDRLQESLYRQLLDAETKLDLQTAMNVAQLGRHFERFADHAVSVAKRVAFIVRGNQDQSAA